MKKKLFEGAGVALVTPFTETGIDFEKLAFLADYQVRHGSDAIIVCGTTGESATMTNDEHIDAIKCVVEAVGGRVPVIAGTGVNDTRHSVLLTQAAQSAGADAALVVSPYYNKTNQNGLYNHFKTIAENTDLPIVLYNVPGRTGVNIMPETLGRLCEIENINSIKECNLLQIPQTLKYCGDNLNLYSGEDGLITMLLGAGGLGVISVVSNFIPQYMHDLVTSFIKGDQKKAWEMQVAVLDLVDALFCDVNPIPAKEVFSILGADENFSRLRSPLAATTAEKRQKIKNALEKMGITKGSLEL